MKLNWHFLFFVISVAVTHAVVDLRSSHESYHEFVSNLTQNPRYQTVLSAHIKDYTHSADSSNVEVTFTCSTQVVSCDQRPTSVHSLRPCDISVVGALGDSITAGNGAKATNIIEVFTEYRGISWSIGGDAPFDEIHTLPNLLRRFNPNIKGFSTGTGSVNSANAHLNAAIPGVTSAAMLHEATVLVNRIRREPGVSFQSDWKVVTLFIGGNNLCQSCKAKAVNSAAQYISDIKAALDYLHSNLPRTFVNLVQVIDVTFINGLEQRTVCKLTHMYLCSCAVDKTTIPTLRTLIRDYRDGLRNLVASGRYDTKDDFTVVLQPFMQESDPPKLAGTNSADMTYFAPDCFHFSQKGHETAAHALWNNMLQPIGNKQLTWNPHSSLLCPTQENFLATSKNSESLKKTMRLQSHNTQTDTPQFDWSVVGGCLVLLVAAATIITIVIVGRRRKSRLEESRYLLESTSIRL